MSDYPLIFRRAQNQPIPGLNSSYNPGQQPVAKPKNKVVARVKSRRQQPAPQDNSDIDAIFRGARELRGTVRRGMSGAQLNPDGSDPGNSFDKFIGQNPHLGTREKRQEQYAMENQQRMNNIRQQGPEAVNARRQQQALDQQIGDPNSVTGADGYKTIFDPRNPGKVIGTNAPMSRTEDNAVNRGTASPQEMQGFRGNLQQAGMQSYGSQPGKANLSGIDQIFPGQSSPPGDRAGSGLVGAGPALGAPGGDFQMGQVPSFQSSGMPIPQASLPDDTPGAASMAARQQAFPQDKMTQYEPPFSNPNQLDALRRLSGLFGQQSPASAGLESVWTDMIPGQKDWDYLATLFPGLVQKGAGASSNMRNLQTLYQDPVYQARF
jgi:hypothetical protein